MDPEGSLHVQMFTLKFKNLFYMHVELNNNYYNLV